jgi:hypothetical protein
VFEIATYIFRKCEKRLEGRKLVVINSNSSSLEASQELAEQVWGIEYDFQNTVTSQWPFFELVMWSWSARRLTCYLLVPDGLSHISEVWRETIGPHGSIT